ncbi:MAG: stage III sporulation protein AB [Gracilibacter sp. BRH_c7a]|nr:MAG: stage III sporulation protein AB [Gracilibacter sp. BRH_c7a]
MLIAGYLGLIIGFGCLGLLKARQIKRRPLEIREMINALALLDTEIFWGSTPLPEAFAFLKERVDFPWKNFFSELETRLRDGANAASAWESAIYSQRKKFSLLEDDWRIISSLGKGLGRSDRNEQHKQLELVQKHLNSVAERARDNAESKAKMWSYLGFLSGMAIVIFIM